MVVVGVVAGDSSEGAAEDLTLGCAQVGGEVLFDGGQVVRGGLAELGRSWDPSASARPSSPLRSDTGAD